MIRKTTITVVVPSINEISKCFAHNLLLRRVARNVGTPTTPCSLCYRRSTFPPSFRNPTNCLPVQAVPAISRANKTTALSINRHRIDPRAQWLRERQLPPQRLPLPLRSGRIAATATRPGPFRHPDGPCAVAVVAVVKIAATIPSPRGNRS